MFYTQDYELKFSIQTSRNDPLHVKRLHVTRISNHIFNIEPLERYYNVIFEGSVKGQASSAKIHIFFESVSQMILFLVGASLIAHFLLLCVKKSKYLKIVDKWDLICHKS